MSFRKLFFDRIVEDFKKKELLPLKLIFFLHASTILVLYPYLTIHMRELGINVRETAIMSAVIPFIAIIMPPVAGMLADKIGNFRALLAFFSTLGGPVALLLLLVPVGRLTITYPESTLIDISCSQYGTLSLSTDERNYSCEPINTVYEYDIDIRIESCGLSCDTDYMNEYDILSSREIEIQENGQTIQAVYYPNLEIHVEEPLNTSEVSRKLKNNELYKQAIRMINKNTIYFPIDNYHFICKSSSYENSTLCELSSNNTQILNTFRVAILSTTTRNDYENENLVREFPLLSLSKNKKSIHRSPVCHEKSKVLVSLTTETDTHIKLENCKPRCLAISPRKHLCSNLITVKERNIQLTFWSYLSVRVLIGIIGGTAFAMFEGAVIAILREHKADYGLQRVYASFGGMISSPLSGWLIDFASRGKGYTDFRPAFWLYAILKVSTGFLILLIRLDFKQPAENVVVDMKTVLRNSEMIALLVACFILGTAWGYIESFFFWLLQDLGGSRSLMGFTITVGGIFGIPLLVMSGPIIDKIGHANVLFIGFVFYAIRLMGYSLLYNAWYCLIYEAMESVTTGLAFTAAVTYAAKLSTTTTDTSIQGLLGGLYFGVGKGSGSLIGGFLISAIGARETYQVFSAVTFFTGIVYFLFNHFYLRKRATEGNEICKKEKPTPTPDVEPYILESIEKKNGDLKGIKYTKESENKKNKENNENKENIMTNVEENLGFEKDESEDLEKNEKPLNNGQVNLAYDDDNNKIINEESKPQ